MTIRKTTEPVRGKRNDSSACSVPLLSFSVPPLGSQRQAAGLGKGRRGRRRKRRGRGSAKH